MAEAETCTNTNHAAFVNAGVACDCAITTVVIDGQQVDCTSRQRGTILGLRRERDSLAARIHGGEHGIDRPELRPRLELVQAELDVIEADLAGGNAYVVAADLHVVARSAKAAERIIEAACSRVFDAGPVTLRTDDGDELRLLYVNAPGDEITEANAMYPVTPKASTPA